MEKALKLDQIVKSPNICDLLDPKDRDDIGRYAQEGYERDKTSRKEWEMRQADANKLALQVREDKNFPWPQCSNVKFPLVTVAAMQFNARAYPALVNANDLVKCQIFGNDTDGSKKAMGERIADHMTWQNLEQDPRWEEDHDKLTLVQAIAGCAFKKRVFDPGIGRQVSCLVLPDNFIIDYYTRDLDSSQRYTHTFFLSKNDIAQREIDGRYCPVKDVPADPKQKSNDEIVVAMDTRQGVYAQQADEATPYFTGEQYCWLDLDDDGFEEPYIITFDIASGEVRRIVARFLPSGIKKRDGKVYEITPVQLFTKYGFIPSPDGGFYDLGLGSILGPINETCNTLINQAIDATTMAMLGGGFVGRGFKSKSGPFTFQPNQWFPVDAPGDDLRKNILPLPVREPTQVLFNLLSLLINYGERIVSATELQVGENIGQNTPAETARTMDENGSRVYNAIYKRTWRAMRDEFRTQAHLNEMFLDQDEDYPQLLRAGMVNVNDYRQSGISVKPAADPNIVSDGERVKQAQELVMLSNQMPGFNRYQCGLRLLKARKTNNINEIYPQPMTQGPDGKPQPAQDFPPPPDPKMLEIQIKQSAQQLEQQKFMVESQETKIKLQGELMQVQAKVLNLQAQAQLFVAQAKSAEMEPEIKLIYAEIEQGQSRSEHLLRLLDLFDGSSHANADRKAGLIQEAMNASGKSGGNGVGGMEKPPQNPAIAGTLASLGPGTSGFMAQ